MKYALAVWWVLTGVVWAEPVRVCEQPDGAVAVVYWGDAVAHLPAAERPTPAHLQGLSCTEQDSAELPTTRRDAWRMKNGKVAVDARVETPQERKQAQRASAEAKLKALGLTDEDIEALR